MTATITCRHGRTLTDGCNDCLSDADWTVTNGPNNSHQGFQVGDGKHPAVCRKCEAPFEGIRPNMDICRSCWYAEEMAQAAVDFAPLSTVIEAAGLRTEVWQTGGMVMCLAAFPTDAQVPYLMWGDPAEFDDGFFCVYVQDDDSEQDLVVETTLPLPTVLAHWASLVGVARTDVTSLTLTTEADLSACNRYADLLVALAAARDQMTGAK